MHIDIAVIAAGLIVGLVVGLTGMGGGALMTPILVIFFNVQPLAAVSSDLVASVVIRPVGAAVHLRRGTVHGPIAGWLTLGSVPAALAGVLVIRALGRGQQLQNGVQIALGAALVLAAAVIGVKAYLGARQRAKGLDDSPAALADINVRRVPTILVGAVGGLVVGMTSVGSGSLIIVALLFLYPRLQSRQLVGTDLVQAIPLVGAAALGHLLFGDFQLSLTASLLLGSIPGVYLGARFSSRASSPVLRPVLAFVLIASGLKLFGVPTIPLGMTLGILAALGAGYVVGTRSTGTELTRRTATAALTSPS